MSTSPYITLRTGNERIEDQGSVPTCMRFAITSALEIISTRAGNPIELSTQYVQYFSQGAWNVPAIIKMLDVGGICLDSTWPYDIPNLNSFPGTAALEEGIRLVPPGSLAMRAVPGVDSIKRAIDSGSPVIVTIISNLDYFFCTSVQRGWRNTAWDFRQPRTGEHEVIIVGYDESVSMFEVIGSYGPYAFDHGVHGIPYSYVQQGVITTADCFTKTPWPLTPALNAPVHEIPRWENGKLYIRSLFKYNGWGTPSETLTNVVALFPGEEYGTVTWDNAGVSGYTPAYRVRANELILPELFIFGQVYRDVKLLGSAFTIESFTPGVAYV